MKTKILGIILSAFAVLSYANDIDSKCPTLVYKSAPVVDADQYICQTKYAVAFSYLTLNPIYTTTFLEASNIGDVPRTNNFRSNYAVPVRYRVTKSDYTNADCNGDSCDKGHLNPSEDFSSDSNTVSESFLLTNIIPQNSRNNRGIWKYLENKIRKYVTTKGVGVYVVTGPAYAHRSNTTIGRGVWVPDHLFKVIIDTTTGKSIAFYMENKDIPTGSLSGKVISLGKLEKLTGITFDKSLDKKSSASYQEWFSGL